MPLRGKLIRTFIIITGTLGVLWLVMPVIPEISLALTCSEPSPTCLPRYRAAGHLWSQRGFMGRAQHWYERGADAGDPIAMFHLGWVYERGGSSQIVVAGKDWQRHFSEFEERLRRFFRTVEQVLRAAMEQLHAILSGRGLTALPSLDSVRREAADLAKEEEWHSLAEDTARTNFLKAAYWYRRATEHAFAPAMNNLGEIYFNGLGVLQDKKEAQRLALAAAEAGNPVGAVNVAILASGAGLRDDDLSKEWSTIRPGKRMLLTLQSRLSSERCFSLAKFRQSEER